MSSARCEECGRPIEGGVAACQRDFEALQARALSEPSTYAMHRLMVDAYALQHAERYCAGPKSYAAHVAGMLVAMEHGGRPEAYRALQRWLSGGPALEKPPLPVSRGGLTIAGALAAADRAALDGAIRDWARSAWQAYEPWHALARGWVARAFQRG